MLEQSLAARPGFAEAHFNLGLARFELGELATVLIGLIALFVGRWVRQAIPLLSRLEMPNAVVGAMIVAGADGFIKNQYRKWNIRSAQTNDDFAMMREVMTRRFGRALDEDPAREGEWPDLVLIDGGKGQMSKVVHFQLRPDPLAK